MEVLRYVNFPFGGGDKAGSVRACAFAARMHAGVGSIAVTEDVVGRSVAEDENIPPPQPMSR